MAQIIGLPKLSPTMEEGVLVKWVKKVGDKVSPGDLVAEVETDKANMDFTIEDEGTVLHLFVKEGETVKLGAPVAILGKPGEDIAALIAQGAAPAAAPAAAPPTPAKPAPVAASPAAAAKPAPVAAAAKPAPVVAAAPGPGPAPGGRLLASPLAKTLAVELGIDLRTVTGSGPGGRIVERDVRAAASDGPRAVATTAIVAAPAVASTAAASADTALATVGEQAGDWIDVPASNMRKRIAARLTEAKRDVPHFYLMRRFDPAPLLAFRTRLNALLGDRGKVSVNDLIVKSAALALRRVPACNAAWVGDAIRRYQRVHVGIAVAIEDGLVTPVVRDADLKGLGVVAAEVADLAKRARERALKGHEITGSTFTVSNLGMFNIERFTAIINPPEAAILAVGGISDEPVVKDGAVVPGKRMTLTLSCDHRVIDGALGAKLLAVIVEQLEAPEALAL
ncbi:MAG: pyruvate dehydrogenase complex dihydrolipoamide acetyltransferase [Myxococcales bacterium]|nr:pyruvate dehydrogenase complex dihydrolipoamide acetyltransferase [Myxococcales bacterium]